MKVEVRRARPDEMYLLCEMDTKIFGDDAFDSPELWEGLEVFLIVVDEKIVGSNALRHHSGVSESIEAEYTFCFGSLYIVTTGILPEWQGKGIGKIVKAWQVDYAREHGFCRIVTNARVSNHRSIELNKKFGFRIMGTISKYYEYPMEDAIILELNTK